MSGAAGGGRRAGEESKRVASTSTSGSGPGPPPLLPARGRAAHQKYRSQSAKRDWRRPGTRLGSRFCGNCTATAPVSAAFLCGRGGSRIPWAASGFCPGRLLPPSRTLSSCRLPEKGGWPTKRLERGEAPRGLATRVSSPPWFSALGPPAWWGLRSLLFCSASPHDRYGE
jgi:hypothetical protein